MVRSSLVALVSAVVLAAPVAVPTADASTAGPVARPNRVTVTDVTDDVWLWVPGDRIWTEVDSWPTADIVEAEVTHWGPKVGDRVVVTMDFVDLQSSERQEFAVKITTPELTRVGWVIVKPGRWRGYHVLEQNGGRAVRATGVTHRVSYTEDTVLLTIPRSRLGNPPWIRVAFLNLMYTAEGGLFQDQPHDASFLLEKDWKRHPPLSGKLYPVVPGSRPAAS